MTITELTSLITAIASAVAAIAAWRAASATLTIAKKKDRQPSIQAQYPRPK
jgi:hypothetical protein